MLEKNILHIYTFIDEHAFDIHTCIHMQITGLFVDLATYVSSENLLYLIKEEFWDGSSK